MDLLTVYVLLNAIISYILNRCKYKAASIVHAIAFTVVFLMLLISRENGVLADLTARYLGENIYETIRYMTMSNDNGLLSPVMVLEMLMPLLAVVISAVFTVKAVRSAIKRRRCVFENRKNDREYGTYIEKRKNISRLYIVNCAMRC